MVTRISPNDYFFQNQPEKRNVVEHNYTNQPQYVPYQLETTQIPDWVPILLGIALVGAFIVALYAIHKK
jgi:hypothetical protein